MKRQARSRVSVLLAVIEVGVFVIFAFGQPSTTAALQSNFVGGQGKKGRQARGKGGGEDS